MTVESTTALQTQEKRTADREGTRPGPLFQPDVDIVERSDEFVVTADLPGVDEEHVHIDLADGVLSIDAELAVTPDPAWTPLYAEYDSGSYHREFSLSDVVDEERIQATMRDGVLSLHLPKTDRHRPRRIDVRAA